MTDGNLASHLKALEREKFIGVEKSFIDRKPDLKYYMTKEGKKAFDDHSESFGKNNKITKIEIPE